MNEMNLITKTVNLCNFCYSEGRENIATHLCFSCGRAVCDSLGREHKVLASLTFETDRDRILKSSYSEIVMCKLCASFFHEGFFNENEKRDKFLSESISAAIQSTMDSIETRLRTELQERKDKKKCSNE
jgi:hypothetical protein